MQFAGELISRQHPFYYAWVRFLVQIWNLDLIFFQEQEVTPNLDPHTPRPPPWVLAKDKLGRPLVRIEGLWESCGLVGMYFVADDDNVMIIN